MGTTMHTRMINDEFVKALHDGGVLSGIVDLVKNYRDERGQPVLYMAFRGSYITVYFHTHVVFNILQQDNLENYLITFDFNHARFSSEYREDLTTLLECGWRLPKDRTKVIKNDSEKRTHSKGKNLLSLTICPNDHQAEKKLRESCTIFLRLMKDFFDSSKTRDYFSIPEREVRVNYAEKDRQQRIALANCFCSNGLYIYDIEYRDPRKSQTTGRYDMLAVQTDSDSIARSILFLELKTTKDSCEGTSGVVNDRVDMKKYLERTDLVDQRIRDCRDIFAAYYKLGLLDKEIKFVEKMYSDFYFLFTDGAKDYLTEHQNDCKDGIPLDPPWVIDASLLRTPEK